MLKCAALFVALVFVASVVGDQYEDLDVQLDKAEPYFEQCLKEKEAIVAEIATYQTELKSYISQRKSGKVPTADKDEFVAKSESLSQHAVKFIDDEQKALDMGRQLVKELNGLIAKAKSS